LGLYTAPPRLFLTTFRILWGCTGPRNFVGYRDVRAGLGTGCGHSNFRESKLVLYPMATNDQTGGYRPYASNLFIY